MWKLIVGFVVFAAVAMFVIFKGGDKLDMSGEKHGADAVHESAPAAAQPSAAPVAAAASAAAMPAAAAASGPASAPAKP